MATELKASFRNTRLGRWREGGHEIGLRCSRARAKEASTSNLLTAASRVNILQPEFHNRSVVIGDILGFSAAAAVVVRVASNPMIHHDCLRCLRYRSDLFRPFSLLRLLF